MYNTYEELSQCRANEFLSDTLGRDWEAVISSGENLHRHYAPLPEEEELTDIPLESTALYLFLKKRK